MKKFIVLMLLFASCVTPDKDQQSVTISKRTFNQVNEFKLTQGIRTDNLSGNARILNLCMDKFIDELKNSIIVDSEKSALYHFCKNYKVIDVSLINISDKPVKINLFNFLLTTNNVEIHPTSPDEMPAYFIKTNWKGNAKNLYNASVITASVAIVAAAISACAKESNCDPVRLINDFYKLSQSDEFDKITQKKIFSKLNHQVNLTYENPFTNNSLILPGKEINGILFFKVPRLYSTTRLKLLNL